MKIFSSKSILFLLTFSILLSCEKGSSDGSASYADNRAGAGGSLARFAIVGNYLYTVDSHNLTVYDITNPGTPVMKSNIYAGFDIETIFPYKDKLYLGASNGLYIYSVADPIKPVKESSITHLRACDPVVSNDSVSYVTLRSGNGSCGSLKNVLNIYNVKDSKNPTLVKEVTMKSPWGLGLKGKALYICEAENGLQVYDLTDPYNPVKKSEVKGDSYFDVIPYDDILIAWIDKGITFFDISDPLNIIKAGTVLN